MANYSAASPYYTTGQLGPFLDVMQNRSVPKNTNDVDYKIDSIYNFRPDLLAYDLYGNAALWWVFASRNPNVLVDPLGDFYTGQIIKIPKKEALVTALGI